MYDHTLYSFFTNYFKTKSDYLKQILQKIYDEKECILTNEKLFIKFEDSTLNIENQDFKIKGNTIETYKSFKDQDRTTVY